jgi:hypothetical protein
LRLLVHAKTEVFAAVADFAMSSDEHKAFDFILVRTMAPREVVCLLLSRFPTTRDLVCPDEYCFEEPIRVYDSFAGIVIERSDNPEFLQSVALFIDEIAESKDRLIKDVLIANLLEGIAANAQVARMISRSISPRSRSLLYEVESKVYGREPMG